MQGYITTHPIACPTHNAGCEILASVTVPDAPGLTRNRYAVVARQSHRDDVYVTWVISPGETKSDGSHSWYGDQGHYGQPWSEALIDMISRALNA